MIECQRCSLSVPSLSRAANSGAQPGIPKPRSRAFAATHRLVIVRLVGHAEAQRVDDLGFGFPFRLNLALPFARFAHVIQRRIDGIQRDALDHR